MTTTHEATDAHTTKALQVANTPTGEYDVHKPMPYPFYIEPDGSVAAQDFWRGEPAALIGFQRVADVHTVDVLADDWLSGEADVLGMHPVFVDAGGGFWSHRHPVMSD